MRVLAVALKYMRCLSRRRFFSELDCAPWGFMDEAYELKAALESCPFLAMVLVGHFGACHGREEDERGKADRFGRWTCWKSCQGKLGTLRFARYL